MKLTKDAIVSHLHRRGRHDDAVRADRELDARVHTVQDIELLRQYQIEESDIDEILGREPRSD